MFKYKLFGFYNANLNSDIEIMFDNQKEKYRDIPMNFSMEFDNIFELTKHIESMNLTKGSYTFIIEIKEVDKR